MDAMQNDMVLAELRKLPTPVDSETVARKVRELVGNTWDGWLNSNTSVLVGMLNK